MQAWLAVRATAAIGERPTAPVPMIGRDRELGVLTRHLGTRRRRGRSHFVTAFGPAGIGKSRIALELAQLVAAQDARAIRGRWTPYGASSPYSAFAQQVKQTARIFDSDETTEAAEKLSAAIASLAGPAAAEEHAPNLATLLGLDGDREAADREQLFFSARVFVEALAMRSPTLLVYEDIHWADGSLLDLLETFAARVRDVPVLFLALARPELLGKAIRLGRRPPCLHRTAPRAARRGCGARTRHGAPRPSRQHGASHTGRRDGRGQSALHRGARPLHRRRAGNGARRAADQHPRDHRREARRIAGRGARRSRRRLGRGPGVLAWGAFRDRGPVGSVAGCSAHSRRATSSSARRCPGSGAISSSPSSTG